MSDATEYFDLWAPYWSYLEDNYFDIESINRLATLVKSPVLVVGAGHGIIVEQLLKQGYKVDGIDLSQEMIKCAKQRRGLDIIRADAKDMPFEDNTYQSAILSTGVIDWTDDNQLIGTIIKEVKRVTDNKGEILVAFYRLHPRVEELMEYIGMISEKRWRIRCTYELLSLKPAAFVSTIRKMRHVSTIGAIVALIKMQLFLPKKEKKMSTNWTRAWKKVQREMEQPTRLIESPPESVPYRGEQQIRDLFERLNVPIKDIHKLYSCIVTQLEM